MKRLIPLLLSVLVLLGCMSGTALAENKFYFVKAVNTVFENETLQLELIREGDCAQEGELTFKSSSKKIATVDEEGVVSGLAKGQSTITATLKVGKKTWTASLTVTVARKVESIEVTGTSLKTYNAWDPLVADALDPASPYGDLPVLLLRMGRQQEITAKCSPTTATNRRWQMTSSDPNVWGGAGASLPLWSPMEAASLGRCLQVPFAPLPLGVAASSASGLVLSSTDGL